MPKPAYKTCRNCGRHSNEAGTLTHSRLCIDCAERIERANNEQIRAGIGPFAEHRLRRIELAARRERLAIEQGKA